MFNYMEWDLPRTIYIMHILQSNERDIILCNQWGDGEAVVASQMKMYIRIETSY